MIQRPFENNIKIVPMANQRKDLRFDFITIVFLRLTIAQSSRDEINLDLPFGKK